MAGNDRKRRRQDDEEPNKNEKSSSISIEETNKLRLSLGLKPLNVSSKSKKNEVDISKTKQELNIERQQTALRLEIEKSKKARKLNEKLQGPSLGELLTTSAATTASDWVTQSRVDEEKSLKKKKTKEASERNEYEAKDLQGMKIKHDMEDFQDGSTVILTLKDSYLLDGAGLNEATDELENVEMSERDRRKLKEAKEKKARMPVYNGYEEEDSFEPHAVGAPRMLKILTQYDEEQKEEAHLILGEQGMVAQVKKKALEMETSRMKNTISTAPTDECIPLPDYYTKEEMVSFVKKPKKMRKKKKNLRKNVANLVETLEAEGGEGESGSSRGARPSALDIKKQEMEKLREKQNRFQNAREQENTRASVALKQQATIVEEDEVSMDADLEESIRKARLKASRRLLPVEDQSTRVAKQLEAQKQQTDRKSEDDESEVFYETNDFDSRVKEAMEEVHRKKITSAQKDTSVEKVEDSKDEKKGSDMEIEDKDVSSKIVQEEVEQEEEWGVEQPLVGGSMSATLQMLRNTGVLRETEAPRLAGRANDYRDKPSGSKDGVQLEYRDEFGRLQTPHQAFRQLSHSFHGVKPGKKKQEKRIKAYKEELEMNKMLSGEGSIATMNAQERRQRQSGQAHVVLS